MMRWLKRVAGFAFMVWYGAASYTTPTTLISPSQITSAPFSITQPGLYVLTDDVNYTTAGGTAITILSNDVILDMNGKGIINSGAGTETGMSLASTLTNVTIKNGTFRVFDGTGIAVTAGCLDINLENLTVIGSGSSAIGFNFAGTSGSAVRTTNVAMNNCNISSCLNAVSATAVDAVVVNNSYYNKNVIGLLCLDCNSWQLNSVQSAFNVNSGAAKSIDAQSCNCWSINSGDFGGNSSTAASAAVTFNTSSGTLVSGGHRIENSIFCNSLTVGGSQTGLELSNTHSCVVRNCLFAGNSSSNSDVTGLMATGSGHVVENCEAEGNYLSAGASNCFGFNVTGTAYVFLQCVSNNNSTQGSGVAEGFRINGIGNSLFGCTASANFSASGTGRGFLLASTTALRCLIKNCVALGNAHQGFNEMAAAGSNLYIGNSSFGHGAAGVNNYVGAIPFLSVAATGPYPLAGFFDNRSLANLSFT